MIIEAVQRVPMAPKIPGARWPMPQALAHPLCSIAVRRKGSAAFGAPRGSTRLTIGPTIGRGAYPVVAPLEGQLIGMSYWQRSHEGIAEVAVFIRCDQIIVGLGCLSEVISPIALRQKIHVSPGGHIGRSGPRGLHFFLLEAQSGVTDGDFLAEVHKGSLVWRHPGPPPLGLLNPTEFLHASLGRPDLIDAPPFPMLTLGDTIKAEISMVKMYVERNPSATHDAEFVDDVFNLLYSVRTIPPRRQLGSAWQPYIDSWIRIRELLREKSQ